MASQPPTQQQRNLRVAAELAEVFDKVQHALAELSILLEMNPEELEKTGESARIHQQVEGAYRLAYDCEQSQNPQVWIDFKNTLQTIIQAVSDAHPGWGDPTPMWAEFGRQMKALTQSTTTTPTGIADAQQGVAGESLAAVAAIQAESMPPLPLPQMAQGAGASRSQYYPPSNPGAQIGCVYNEGPGGPCDPCIARFKWATPPRNSFLQTCSGDLDGCNHCRSGLRYALENAPASQNQ